MTRSRSGTGRDHAPRRHRAISLAESERIPDPFSPAPRPTRSKTAVGAPYFTPGREHQRQRRARILAVVRRLIAEVGSQNITVRRVAELSEVSVQTIYNLVGNRAQMIGDAIGEQITLVTRKPTLDPGYPNIALALADMIWRHVAMWPDFVRQANSIYFGPDRDIYYRLRDEQITRLRTLLRRQYEDGLLRDHVDINMLAEHIALIAGGLSIEWSDGRLSLEELRVRLISGYCYLLGDALVASEAEKVSQWLASFRSNATV